MTTPVYVVDAFTDRPFAGNPAAVVPLDGPRSDDWMQSVAAEMNLSETAFTYPEGDGWRLRWRTPGVEVDLCGHATLAAAHALWETGRVERSTPIRFRTRSGTLTASPEGDRIALDFPALSVHEVEPPEGLVEALGVTPTFVGSTKMDAFVELESEAVVRGLKPDLMRLKQIETRGVIVTAKAHDRTAGYDFVSRFFAPAVGVLEDPVTGSAHCALAPYWAAKLGSNELVGYQASRRGGGVGVALLNDRVKLLGHAVMVMRGELLR